MAEAIGVVASAFTVAEAAMGVVSVVHTLRKVWDEIQNVPESIEHLMKQVELLDPLIVEMEHDTKTRYGSASSDLKQSHVMQKSLEYCQQSTMDLKSLVNDMQSQVSAQRKVSRAVAKVKVIMKKQTLLAYEKRLHNSVTMLMFAQQVYLMELIKAQPSILAEKLGSRGQLFGFYKEDGAFLNQETLQPRRMEKACTQLDLGDEYGSRPSGLRPRSHKCKMRVGPVSSSVTTVFGFVTMEWKRTQLGLARQYSTDYRVLIHLPAILLRRAIELRITMATAGWTTSLRAWRVVIEDDSAAFRAVKNHDSQSLRQCLERGPSTLFDRNESGENLLHVALSVQSFDCARILANAGIDFFETDDHGLTALDIFSLKASRHTESSRGIPSGMEYSNFHALLTFNDVFDDLENTRLGVVFLPVYLNTMVIRDIQEAVDFVKRQRFPSCSQMVGNAPLEYVFDMWVSIPLESVTIMMDDLSLRTSLVESGDSALIYIALCLGNRRWPMEEKELRGWKDILRLLFEPRTLHSTAHEGMSTKLWNEQAGPLGTPFLVLIWAALHWSISRKAYATFRDLWLYHLQPAVRSWLFIISECGFDLHEYGKVEQEFLQHESATLNGSYLFDLSRISKKLSLKVRLVNIRYSSKIEEWDLEWAEEAERPPSDARAESRLSARVPGQWVSED
ncbi:uncharacterized protein JN550_004993 [Neoarthrinium moseri]|uniref:uncharacterized protein n=1 Tax=Neoarthrinium moseri TaxID=1658444 RepID=UPI001FDC7C72|nr:uncharacterized protein JN550_004993 [Neoarthrinium moseri]KAI1870847.1 hypothetical protein JN550_004993 [Neoarthrinium moseri]